MSARPRSFIMDFRNHRWPNSTITGANCKLLLFPGTTDLRRPSVNPQHEGAVHKKAYQRLYPLQCLGKCGISTGWCLNFYHGIIESVLSGGVTVWYGNTTAQDRKGLQRVTRMVGKIIGCALPSIEEIFQFRCLSWGQGWG